jgi:hypothetical protein
MINKDFLKDVLAEKKRLIPLKDVIFVNVPKYDELSVKNVWPMIQQDKELMTFFPEKLPKGRMPDRDYTFNVLNTLREDYVDGIIKHAQKQRNTAADNNMQAQFIRVTPAWQEQLEKIPFVSSKLFITHCVFRVTWQNCAFAEGRQQASDGAQEAQDLRAGREACAGASA